MRGELNIPNRERRARRRILTLKNAVIVALGLVLLMVAVVLYARRKGSESDYGRLSSRQIAQPEQQARRPLDVITEAPAPYRDAPDPSLGVPAGAGQSAGASGMQPPPAMRAKAPASVAAQPGDHMAIVGDDKGVVIAPVAGAASPKLKGGFGKPQDVPVTVTDGTTRQ